MITGQTQSMNTLGAWDQGIGGTPTPAEPTLLQRLLEAEQYLDGVHVTLDQLQGIGEKNGVAKDPPMREGSITVAARVCEKAAILGSRIKTIAGQVGTL